MTGELLTLGANHKTAPLPLRERLALPDGRAARVLSELVEHEAVHEAVAISTCNRTELYLVTADPVEAENAALGVLSRQAGLRPTELLGAIYSLRGSAAVEHLFAVTSGLDSMIVGEAEVQGQVKRSYEMALVEGVTGPVTNRLFRDALATGKRVRTETDVSRSSVSVSSVAVKLAADFLGDLTERRVLVIGAGENAELTARALRDRGVEALFVANRRYDRALGLAQRYGGRAIAFDDLPGELERADIVVSSTGAPHQILGREELEFVAASRMGRPLVMIDLAVPRDIEPSVRDCPGIALYDMDDLQTEVARNLSGRQCGGRRGARARARGGGPLRGVARQPRRRADHLGAASPRRRDRGAGAARERVALGVAVRGGSRAARHDGERRGEPAAARADPAPARRGRRGHLVSLRARPARAVRARGRTGPARGGARRGRPARRTPPAPRPVIRLGTRGSALALAQARWVAERLPGEVELVPITTSGDQGVRPPKCLRLKGSDPLDKSRFVKEIEEALLAGDVDLAVHSAKDVPSELPDGLAIVGVPERADARDALCGAGSLDELAEGAAVGTASLRRRAALLALRPDLDVRELRGNVDTRLTAACRGRFRCDRAGLAPAWSGSAAATRARRSTWSAWCRRRARAASRSRPGADDATWRRRLERSPIVTPSPVSRPSGRSCTRSTPAATPRSARTP